MCENVWHALFSEPGTMRFSHSDHSSKRDFQEPVLIRFSQMTNMQDNFLFKLGLD